jgi:hypothetical protein
VHGRSRTRALCSLESWGLAEGLVENIGGLGELPASRGALL